MRKRAQRLRPHFSLTAENAESAEKSKIVCGHWIGNCANVCTQAGSDSVGVVLSRGDNAQTRESALSSYIATFSACSAVRSVG